MTTGKHWYLRWWGILILAFLAVVALLLLVFFLYVGKLVREIRQGRPISDKGSVSRQITKTNLPGSSSGTTRSDQSVKIATDDDPSLGPKNAKAVIVEFGDFQCPFCRQAFTIVREFEATYRNKIRFVYRDFPITQIHQFAFKAAEAGQCAHEQGKFWPYHDTLFTNQGRLDIASLKVYAVQVGLNESRFNNCLDSGKYSAEVQADFDDGLALGVGGTPTWFINGRRVDGVISLEDFKRYVDGSVEK